MSSKNSNSLKKYTLKNFENFSMVLEYHRKLDFAKFEYQKSDRFLHIFKIMVDCNIICENVLFGYFRPLLLYKNIVYVNFTYTNYKLSSQELQNLLWNWLCYYTYDKVIIAEFFFFQSFYAVIAYVMGWAMVLFCNVLMK